MRLPFEMPASARDVLAGGEVRAPSGPEIDLAAAFDRLPAAVWLW